MARLRVTDKIGLGRLVLAAATDKNLRADLVARPERFLRPYLEELPEGHVIKVVEEGKNVAVLVLPSEDDVPSRDRDKEVILREEAREYDEARRYVEESKEKDKSIPPKVVEETYALMIGHTALSPTSRPRSRPAARARAR